MKKWNSVFILLIFMFSCYNNSTAQQIPLFTQYRQHATIINPAMITSDYIIYENNISVGVSHRTQWRAIENHPVTQTLIGDVLLPSKGSVSLTLGGYCINDQTGPTGFTGAYGKVGAILSDDPYYSGLSIGLTAGAVQYRVRFEELRLRDFSDNVPLLNQSKVFPDVGLGIFYYNRFTSGQLDNTMLYGGVSIPQVFGINLEYDDIVGMSSIRRIQHVYGQVGFYKFLKNETFVEASAWAKYAPNTPVSIDFNIRYQLSSGFWLGTGLSTAGISHVETGFVIGEQLRIGYGFDYAFTTFGGLTGGAHELHVNYAFSIN